MKKNFMEERILTVNNLHALCIDNGYFTCGNNDEYEKLFNMVYKKDSIEYAPMTTNRVEKIARYIAEHSYFKYNTNAEVIADVMYEIIKRCDVLVIVC